MQTIKVQINNERAIKLLQELEELKLIKLIKSKKKPIKITGKLSDKAAKALHRHIRKTRADWERR
jgi:hypothetical protein